MGGFVEVGVEGRDLDPLCRRLTNLRLMISAMNSGTKGLQPRLAEKASVHSSVLDLGKSS